MGLCILKTAIAVSCAAILTACGGGGGGGGAGTTNTGPVAVEGKIQFESIPFGNKGLDYANTLYKPARAVIVELVDLTGKTLAAGTTDANGRYRLVSPTPVAAKLRVYAIMQHASQPGSNWSVTVADNTNKGALWSAETQPFMPGETPGIITTTLGSGWKLDNGTGQAMADKDRAAAPFAILDTIYESQEKVRSALPGATFKPLLVFWSPNNRPSSTYLPLDGQIGGSHFTGNSDLPAILLTGKADVDTDEYDSSVITHEWAHYYQQFYSRNDSIGGSHAPGDQLDRTVAFSEGLATAWSGMVLKRGNYVDTYGAGQALAFQQDMENGPATRPGWFDEYSIAHVLWKLDRTVGTAPLIRTLTSSFKTQAANTGLHAFNAALVKVDANAGAAFRPILLSQNIAADADAWGVGETNGGSSTVALPLTRLLTVANPFAGACVSRELDPGLAANKLGEVAYFRISIKSAGIHYLSVLGQTGSHPFFIVSDGAGMLNRSVVHPTSAVTASIGLYLPAGDFALRLTDEQFVDEKICFNAQLTQGSAP